ncbi:MAG: histidinol-phosphatase HisJ [Ignavibacteriales bacterium]|nr:histidinol-phosphatase HisJ [Ignavibacteriales bacterium]
MLVDYHTHTEFCKHAQGGVEDYVKKAVDLGFDEIGCSDHAPLPGNYDERHRMNLEEYYSQYAPMVSGLIEKYQKRIRIKRGIECDFLDWASEWNSKFIAENSFDFVIGSVHFVGPRGEEKPLFGCEYDETEIEALYEGYFLEIANSAKAGLFDIIAHCDIVKKFGSFSSKRVDELMWEALSQIKKADLCIEINTSGLRKPKRETYPGEKVLTIARDLKIPLTLGSDAHNPERVGMGFDHAINLIKKYGNGRISVFERRRRTEAKVG